MNHCASRTLTGVCESCIARMQGVAELLLLSCSVRPVMSEFLGHLQCGTVLTVLKHKLKTINVLSETIASHVHMVSSKWNDICESLHELSLAVVQLIELVSHSSYLIVTNFPKCSMSNTALVDRYIVSHSGLEIKLSCMRLKRTRSEELSPQIIIDLCSNISKHIAVITDICKVAGQNVHEENLEDQFKLSVKSVTCAAGCLIASIKSYKSSQNTTHHSRVVLFCEPVLAATQALVSFATEENFTGSEGGLTLQAKEVQKKILGVCMNVVSASIQLCKTVRDLTYDLMTSHHKGRLQSCLQSTGHSSRKLVQILEEYDIDKLLSDFRDKTSHLSVPKDTTAVSTLTSSFSFSPNVSPVDSRSLAESLTTNSVDGSCHGNSTDNDYEHSTSLSENSLASR